MKKKQKMEVKYDTRDGFERALDKRYVSGPLALIYGYTSYVVGAAAYNLYNRMTPNILVPWEPQFPSYLNNPERFAAIFWCSALTLAFAFGAAMYGQMALRRRR